MLPLQVLSNVDELFEREELSAAPDPGWPDCFNSGVFVFRPSVRTHRRLLEHAKCHGSFDGEAASRLALQPNVTLGKVKGRGGYFFMLQTGDFQVETRVC